MATFIPIPGRSPGHQALRSPGHQRLGVSKPKGQFALMLGGKLWKGWPGFLNGYFWIAGTPVTGNHWNLHPSVTPSYIGPLFTHFEESRHILADGGYTDDVQGDIDDTTLLITRTEVFTLAGVSTTTVATGANEPTGPLPGEFASGGEKPDSDTHYAGDFGHDPNFPSSHFTGDLSQPKGLGDIQAEEWAMAKTLHPAYGKQSIIVKNYSGQFGTGSVQIGLTPASITQFGIPFSVGWNGAPAIFGDGTAFPVGTFTATGDLQDGAFFGSPGGAAVFLNVAGGYIVSYSTRTRNWANANYLYPTIVDFPLVVGAKFKNVFQAALATYEIQPGVNLPVKISCVDVNYGGAETLITPFFTDQKAYDRYQVLFPGRKAASIGGVNQRWS